MTKELLFTLRDNIWLSIQALFTLDQGEREVPARPQTSQSISGVPSLLPLPRSPYPKPFIFLELSTPYSYQLLRQCPMTYDVNCIWLEPAPGRELGQFFGGDVHLAGNIGLAANILRTAHPQLHF